METPASVARSEKPTSCIEVCWESGRERETTQLRPSSRGIWNPTSIESVRRGRLRCGANTLLYSSSSRRLTTTGMGWDSPRSSKGIRASSPTNSGISPVATTSSPMRSSLPKKGPLKRVTAGTRSCILG